MLNDIINENPSINKSHFVGEINQQKVIKDLKKFDIFVFASSSETFGISLVEAMAVGMPIVSSNKSSLPEVLQNGGLYFDPKDDLQLSNQIELLITNEVYAATILGIILATGLRLVAMKYNWNLPKVRSS